MGVLKRPDKFMRRTKKIQNLNPKHFVIIVRVKKLTAGVGKWADLTDKISSLANLPNFCIAK